MLDVHQYVFETHKYGPELLVDIYHKHNDEGLGFAHQLDYYEIALIAQGSGRIFFDEEPFPLWPCAACFTPPGPIRRWEVKPPFRAVVLIFTSDFIDQFFNDALFLYKLQYFHHAGNRWLLRLPSAIFAELFAEFEAMDAEVQSLRKDSVHMLRATLYRLLIKLNRLYSDTHGVESDTEGLPLVKQLRQLIESHFQRQRRVNDYADMLHITPGHLNYLIKRHTGRTVSAHIRDRVMAECKRLLIHSNMNVAEISWSLNFHDPSYFVRYFRKHGHCTPLEYRRRIQREHGP